MPRKGGLIRLKLASNLMFLSKYSTKQHINKRSVVSSSSNTPFKISSSNYVDM